MNYFVFLTFILCVACSNAQSAVDETPFSCTPLEWFKKECNSCQCGASGTWAQCDVQLCDPEDSTKVLQGPKNCKDKDKCCSETGTFAVCNFVTCDPDDKSNRLKEPENCQDDDKWSDGCNACYCIKGSFACTRKMCSSLLGTRPEEVVGTDSPQIDVQEPTT
ncbi:unnamed protein product [Diamesa serratosioi]